MTTPGYYPDPYQRFEYRHWDGQRWTEHVWVNGFATVDPAVGADIVPATPAVSRQPGAPQPHPMPQMQSSGAGAGCAIAAGVLVAMFILGAVAIGVIASLGSDSTPTGGAATASAVSDVESMPIPAVAIPRGPAETRTATATGYTNITITYDLPAGWTADDVLAWYEANGPVGRAHQNWTYCDRLPNTGFEWAQDDSKLILGVVTTDEPDGSASMQVWVEDSGPC